MTEQELKNSLQPVIESLQKFCSSFNNAPPEQQDDKKEEQIDKTIYSLDATLYTNLEPLTPTMSKGRVRIFYTGLNRNRTYISEDFANQLISSLPYSLIRDISLLIVLNLLDI